MTRGFLDRTRFAGVLECTGGCEQCHGSYPEAGWTGKNTAGVAARHHDATGHITWVEQVLHVSYGGKLGSDPKEIRSHE